MNHVIPPKSAMMNPMWGQPKREEILVDDKVAIMSEFAFGMLREYSCTDPTGLYTGKMWKAHRRDNDTWYLCWYAEMDVKNHIYRHQRLIQIMDWQAMMGVTSPNISAWAAESMAETNKILNELTDIYKN